MADTQTNTTDTAKQVEDLVKQGAPGGILNIVSIGASAIQGYVIVTDENTANNDL
jgi:hypothetical protein